MLIVLVGTVGMNFWLFRSSPRDSSRSRTPGRMVGFVVADQTISFQSMSQKLRQFLGIVQGDPAVDVAVGDRGRGRSGQLRPSVHRLEAALGAAAFRPSR